MSFVPLLIAAGIVLSVPYIAYARAKPRAFSWGLVFAALVYVAFAVAALDLDGVIVELGGAAVFISASVIALRRTLAFAAFGWSGHALWDLIMHSVEPRGYAPWWYPLLCVGFDVVVAGYILSVSRSRLVVRTHGTKTER